MKSAIGAFTILLLTVIWGSAPSAQSYTIAPTPFQTAFDNSGNVINNACVWTYAAGTTTPATTYSDNAGTPNTNPIRSDSAGRFTAYLVPGTSYKFTYEAACTPPAHGTVLRTADNVAAIPSTTNPTTTLDTVNLRLTLTTLTPVTTADVTAATTIYATPFKGNRVALYDGSTWNLRTLTETAITVPSTTSTMYDVFCYDSSSTPTFETLAWTNDTTRATALTTQDGVLVKSGSLTRRYIGSFRTTTVSGQTEDSLAKRYLWNYYNRVAAPLQAALETADSWTYTTDTWRQANANAANQLDLIVGYAEDGIEVFVQAGVGTSAGSANARTAIGEDSTSAPDAKCLIPNTTATAKATNPSSLKKIPAVGRHFYAWLERSGAAGTTTWYGDDSSTNQNGMNGMFRR